LNAVLANLQDIVNDRNKLVTLNALTNIAERIFVAAVGVGINKFLKYLGNENAGYSLK